VVTALVAKVGRHLTAQFANMGIHTALDLKQADPKAIRRQFNVMVERTVAELNGISCLSLEDVSPDKPSAGATPKLNSKSWSAVLLDRVCELLPVSV